MERPVRHSENREDIGFQLVMVSRRYRKAMDAVFAENDLSDATSLPLRYLARQETPLRQKDLADRLAIEGPTLVRTLDMLVSKGCKYTGVPHLTDQRQTVGRGGAMAHPGFFAIEQEMRKCLSYLTAE